MENWLYRARELWLLHKREIKRYGCCAALIISALYLGRYAGAWIGLGAAAVMWAYDRWGQPWAERGRRVMSSKKSNPNPS